MSENSSKKYTPASYTLFILILLFAVLSIFFTILYRYDNKYNGAQAPFSDGRLILDQTLFRERSIYALVDHWDYYNQHYLSPEQLKETAAVPEDIYIGQYPDFSMRNTSGQLYGTGTYRLLLHATQPLHLVMYLPEIYSSYELWIDGRKLVESGSTKELLYSPYIQSRTIHFEANGKTEIVIAVRNSSHYYSGMYFAPLLSSEDGAAMDTALLRHNLFYAFLSFSTLGLSIYTLSLWKKMRQEPAVFYFFLLTFSFAAYSAYPLLAQFGFSNVQLVYGLYDMTYFLMMYALIRINTVLSGTEKKRGFRLLIHPLSITVMILSLISDYWLGSTDTTTIRYYGHFIDMYKFLVLGYVLYTSYLGIRKQQRSFVFILSANLIYGYSVILTLLSANRFEPVIYGWLNDYCGYLIVISVSAYMMKENRRIVKENELLTGHLEEEVRLRTEQLGAVLKERKLMLSEIAHDIKAPLSSLAEFVEFIRMGNVQVDSETSHYLDVIQNKSHEAMSRMSMLKELTVNPELDMRPVPVAFNDFLQKQYDNFKPDSDANAIYLEYENCPESVMILGVESELCRVFDNLLYNALNFTPENQTITLRLCADKDYVHVEIQDTGIGIAPEYLDRIFERSFSLRADARDRGIGLYIASNIIKEHSGQITVSSVTSEGTTFCITLPRYYSTPSNAKTR